MLLCKQDAFLAILVGGEDHNASRHKAVSRTQLLPLGCEFIEHLLFALPTLRLVDLEVSECGLNAFDVVFLHLGVVVEWRTSEALWAGLRGVATTGSQVIIELLLFVDLHVVPLTSVLLRLVLQLLETCEPVLLFYRTLQASVGTQERQHDLGQEIDPLILNTPTL